MSSPEPHDPEALVRSFDEAFKLLNTQYFNIVSRLGKNRSQDCRALFIRLRDSAYHRFESLVYHGNLIELLQTNHLEAIDVVDQESSRRVLRVAAKQQNYLFDDVVFASASLLDYLGNISGLIFYGQNGAAIKWAGAVDLATGRSRRKDGITEVPLSSSLSGALIRERHAGWVDKFSEYRGELTHRRAEKPNGAIRHHYYSQRTDVFLDIYAPSRLVSLLGLQNSSLDVKEVLLRSAYAWLMEQLLLLCGQLFGTLCKDLESIPPNANPAV